MVGVDEAFEIPARSFRNANRHINTIGRIIRNFSESKPYEYFIVEDDAPGTFVHAVRQIRGPDEDIGVIAFDAINNLRSSLDHSMYASVRALRAREPTYPNAIEFPFGKDEKDARRKLRSKSEVHPEVFEAALRFKPYSGGDRLLHGLDTVRNIKNHRIILDFTLGVQNLAVSSAHFVGDSNSSTLSIEQPRWNEREKRLDLFRSGSIIKAPKIDIGVRVLFDNFSPFNGESLYDILISMLGKVSDVLSDIEDVTTQIISRR
ncbi:hypothetical protein SAMN02799631_02996 [Methylobacterium sp. 174MFSha1.1]|nr:hypothetical protein SAMN02799631_02996 [Methylobacterium sp. 174MFSha1.1]